MPTTNNASTLSRQTINKTCSMLAPHCCALSVADTPVLSSPPVRQAAPGGVRRLFGDDHALRGVHVKFVKNLYSPGVSGWITTDDCAPGPALFFAQLVLSNSTGVCRC